MQQLNDESSPDSDASSEQARGRGTSNRKRARYCYENGMVGGSPMHPTHTVDIRAASIFIHNGAPQALVGLP